MDKMVICKDGKRKRKDTPTIESSQEIPKRYILFIIHVTLYPIFRIKIALKNYFAIVQFAGRIRLLQNKKKTWELINSFLIFDIIINNIFFYSIFLWFIVKLMEFKMKFV